MQREIKYRFRLKLVIDSCGAYKKGDIDTFYIKLLDESIGIFTYGIDKQWEVVACDECLGIKDWKGVEIHEGDILDHYPKFETKYVVKRLVAGFYICPLGEEDYGEPFASLFAGYDKKQNQCNNIEVIGNIHAKEKLTKNY